MQASVPRTFHICSEIPSAHHTTYTLLYYPVKCITIYIYFIFNYDQITISTCLKLFTVLNNLIYLQSLGGSQQPDVKTLATNLFNHGLYPVQNGKGQIIAIYKIVSNTMKYLISLNTNIMKNMY